MHPAILAMFAMTDMTAPPSAAAPNYCDYYTTDVVPGLTLTYHPKGGRAYFYGEPPYAADTFNLSFDGKSGQFAEYFNLDIDWPEAPSAAASFSLPVRGWDVLVVSNDRPPPVGSSLRVVADGQEIARLPGWFSAERMKLMGGVDRLVLPQPAPDFRRYRSLIVSIDGPDGAVVATKTYRMPAWKKLGKAFARAADRLVRAKDEFRARECHYWPIAD
jgi:hypothetical protein